MEAGALELRIASEQGKGRPTPCNGFPSATRRPVIQKAFLAVSDFLDHNGIVSPNGPWTSGDELENAVSASLNRKNDMGEFPHGNSPTWKQSEEALGLLRTL